MTGQRLTRHPGQFVSLPAVKKIARLWRHLVIDLTPLRRSRDLRRLTAGQLFSVWAPSSPPLRCRIRFIR